MKLNKNDLFIIEYEESTLELQLKNDSFDLYVDAKVRLEVVLNEMMDLVKSKDNSSNQLIAYKQKVKELCKYMFDVFLGEGEYDNMASWLQKQGKKHLDTQENVFILKELLETVNKSIFANIKHEVDEVQKYD